MNNLLKRSKSLLKNIQEDGFFNTFKNNIFGKNARSTESKIYRKWLKNKYLPSLPSQNQINSSIKQFRYKPKFSIVIPNYNALQYLKLAVESVKKQSYDNWELVIVDDCSTDKNVSHYLNSIRSNKIKIIFNKKNLHISRTSNIGIANSTGEYICFLDNDDELDLNALYWIAHEINKNYSLEFIYSDEDKIDELGRLEEPTYKPEWMPHLLLSFMYTNHFAVYKRSLLKKLGGLRTGYEGSQDYDLVLRATDFLNANNVKRIDKFLYHWRSIPGSTVNNYYAKPYAKKSAEKLLTDFSARKNLQIKKIEEIKPGVFRLSFTPLNTQLYLITKNTDIDVLNATYIESPQDINSEGLVIFIDKQIIIGENFKRLFDWFLLDNVSVVAPSINNVNKIYKEFMYLDTVQYNPNKIYYKCFVTTTNLFMQYFKTEINQKNLDLLIKGELEHNKYPLLDASVNVKIDENMNKYSFNNNLDSYLEYAEKK